MCGLRLLASMCRSTEQLRRCCVQAGSTPDMAEAARSGGRAGGSAGFSRSRAAPAPQRTAPSAPCAPISDLRGLAPRVGKDIVPFLHSFHVTFLGTRASLRVADATSVARRVADCLFLASVLIALIRNMVLAATSCTWAPVCLQWLHICEPARGCMIMRHLLFAPLALCCGVNCASSAGGL